jgi:hypothetical protein
VRVNQRVYFYFFEVLRIKNEKLAKTLSNIYNVVSLSGVMKSMFKLNIINNIALFPFLVSNLRNAMKSIRLLRPIIVFCGTDSIL